MDTTTFNDVITSIAWLDHSSYKTIMVNLAKHNPTLFLKITNADGKVDPSQALDVDTLASHVVNLAKYNRRQNHAWGINESENPGKVEMIKAYRILTGMGLKESKDWVEAHIPGMEPNR